MKRVVISSNLKEIRKAIESSGNLIGSVHFRKRSTGTLRKMSYRLHVTNPSISKAPSGKRGRVVDMVNGQMVVYDNNKVLRNKDNVIIGRGAYRTIPLETVERVVARGTEYLVRGRTA